MQGTRLAMEDLHSTSHCSKALPNVKCSSKVVPCEHCHCHIMLLLEELFWWPVYYRGLSIRLIITQTLNDLGSGCRSPHQCNSPHYHYANDLTSWHSLSINISFLGHPCNLSATRAKLVTNKLLVTIEGSGDLL